MNGYETTTRLRVFHGATCEGPWRRARGRWRRRAQLRGAEVWRRFHNAAVVRNPSWCCQGRTVRVRQCQDGAAADRCGSRETLLDVADQNWIAVNQVVEAALADGAILERPPGTDDEVMWLAATITDHVVAAFVTEPRRN
jgi:hypothetical protein